MARRRHDTSALRAQLRAVLTEAPDHYEILDRGLVARLAGFLFCCAGLIAAVLLALDAPTHAIGGPGWIPAAATIGLAFGFGVGMVVNRRLLSPALLMATALSGPLMLGTLQWLAGPGSSFAQLLILSVVWCGVVLPPRRLLVVLLCDTVVVFLPALSSDWSAGLLPERLATLGIAWTLALVCLVHSARVREIRRTLDARRVAAHELARVDALTGLGNRRALDEALVAQAALAHRTGRPLSALVGDLDAFKQINDRLGHHAGDVILTAVAAVLRDVVRTPDAVFRWGGDEFVVLLAEVDLAGAEAVAGRISDAVRARCATADGQAVGISLGAAEHVAGAPGSRLIAIADAALLAAKAGGSAPARGGSATLG